MFEVEARQSNILCLKLLTMADNTLFGNLILKHPMLGEPLRILNVPKQKGKIHQNKKSRYTGKNRSTAHGAQAG